MTSAYDTAAVLERPTDEHELQDRVQAEFREMPGLKLTLRQASRLFGLEPPRCDRVLATLVRAGQLTRIGDTFVRAGTDRRYALTGGAVHRR